MIYRKLGKTNLKISVIGFGAGVLNRDKDPEVSLEKAREVIELAVSKGVNFIDIGKEYDEKFLSQAIGRVRKKIHVISRSEARNVTEMKKDINESIKKLKPTIYEITVNSIEDLKEKKDVIEVLKEAKVNGKIKFIGIFSHRIDVLKEAIKTNEFDVIMTLYNAVHRKAEEIFPLKRKYGFGFIAVAPFATGILVDPKYDKNVHIPGSEFMTAENALKFVLSSPYVDATVIGMKNIQHIEENVKIASIDWKIDESERTKITKRAEKFLGNNFCRMCRYCEGHPPGVSVADILRLFIIGKRYGYLNFAKWQYLSLKEKIFNKNFKESEKFCPYNLPINKLILTFQKIMENYSV
ncbi:MAG: aldo/keto reductase [Candidatus Aenigmatarchaeota archaeon]